MMKRALIVAVLLLAVHSASVQVKDPAQCTLCKSGVSELKVILEDQDTKDLLNLVKDWVCANIPIEDCDNWVTDELAQLDTVV